MGGALLLVLQQLHLLSQGITLALGFLGALQLRFQLLLQPLDALLLDDVMVWGRAGLCCRSWGWGSCSLRLDNERADAICWRQRTQGYALLIVKACVLLISCSMQSMQATIVGRGCFCAPAMSFLRAT